MRVRDKVALVKLVKQKTRDCGKSVGRQTARGEKTEHFLISNQEGMSF